MSSIVIATDFSAAGEAALEWGRAIARSQEARVDLVHAIQPPFVATDHISISPATVEPYVQAARDRLEGDAEAYRAAGLDVGSEVAVGRPSDVILDFAARIEADLVVVGTRGHGRLERLLLGSTAHRVVQQSTCPVLSVQPGTVVPSLPLSVLLVPCDGSGEAVHVARRALEIFGSSRDEGRLVLLSAWHLPVAYAVYGYQGGLHLEEHREEVTATLTRELEEIGELLAGEAASIETVVREDDPAAAIVEEAASSGAEVIAMGTRGASALARTFLGSVAESVVQLAPCPVLTVRLESGSPATGHGG